MSGFNLADYEPVEDRIRKFWEEQPTGRIATTMLHGSEGQYIVQAAVYRDSTDEFPAASGLAEEFVADRGVNKTSALENCETSAIGRALANLGYAAKGKRPSREEMSKPEPAPREPTHAQWLKDAVLIFKAWTDDERRAAYKQAMTDLGFESMGSMADAQKVFTKMTEAYNAKSEAEAPFE